MDEWIDPPPPTDSHVQTGLRYRRLGWRFRRGRLIVHRPWRMWCESSSLVLYACTILRFVTNVTDWRVLGYMINARKQRTVTKSCPAPAPAPAVGHDRVDGGTVDRDSTTPSTPSPRSRLSTTSPPFQHSRPCPRSRQAACTCHLPPVRL